MREAARLRTLLETGLAISSELSIDAVLQTIVEASARVTGARYAALGVIDRSGTALERFVTHGIDAETHAAIGDLPRGRGILGALINDARTLRLHDLSEDPRSVGFPPNHPPMRSFLGVPIMLRGVAYGNLYLTEKDDGETDFDEEDEEFASLLAAQAAVAIENARLYESATAWSRQLESLHEIGTALAAELELPRILQLVAARLRQLIGARLVAIALPAGADLRIEAIDGEEAEALLHSTIPAASKVGRVLGRGRGERVDSLLEDPEVVQEIARRFKASTGLYVPLVVRETAIGVVIAHDKLAGDSRFTSGDQRLAEQFADRAAVAVDLSQRVARDSLRRLLEGQELERKRLARELHDETGQALTSVLIGLKGLEEANGESELREAAKAIRDLVVSTMQDVRRLAVELRPKALDDFGLVPALERLVQMFVEATGIDVHMEAQVGEARLPSEIETTLYRIVQEALTNIAKHSGALEVSIVLVRRGPSVTVLIEDNGHGFDPQETAASAEGIGLTGMRERVALVEGRLEVDSSPGGGTTIVAEVPVA